MRNLLVLLTLHVWVVSVLSHLDEPALPNANHIFNAIHSSMRQWGSSLNHNGMSFFLAKVPKDTRLYHGSPTSVPVSGMEWLAFEPEHALIFARPRSRRNPPKSPSGARAGNEQEILTEANRPQGKPLKPANYGYFHTYKTKRALRLLYIDGMSAGKTLNGTLDSQDYLLLNSSLPCSGVQCEARRAQALCDVAETEWHNRIDGFLRMEAGFELIICSFNKNLNVVGISQINPPKKGSVSGPSGIFYYQSVNTRFHGIGGGRVTLDYERFVTAFNYPVDLFKGHDGTYPRMPRLKDVDQPVLAQIRSDLKDLIMNNDLGSIAASFDWQATTDMFVHKYTSKLRYLTAAKIRASNKQLRETLYVLLRPFIDDAARNSGSEVVRCIEQFFPPERLADDALAARVVYDIGRSICSTLLSAFKLVSSESDAGHEQAIGRLQELMDYLQWTSWKECKNCDDDEICFVPVWPLGTLEDHRNPSCVNADALRRKVGYWGW